MTDKFWGSIVLIYSVVILIEYFFISGLERDKKEIYNRYVQCEAYSKM